MQGEVTDQGRVLLIDFGVGSHGHRGQWNALFDRLFGARPAPFGWRSLVSRAPVLVPSIEHSPSRFLLLGLVRGLLRRRTAGILMRPLPALHGSGLRLGAKRLALRLLRLFPSTRVLTIVPFAVEPGFARIAAGWFHDPQEWDLVLDAARPDQDADAVTAAIAQAAAGRTVCCAIGGQNVSKGFDRLAQTYLAHPELRDALFIAFGGVVDPALKNDAAALVEAGTFAMDRYISDAELFALHAAADLVWCNYDPDYDQASGILGRAMQNGVPAVVRAGSLLERLCRLEGHPCIALQTDADWVRLLSPPSALPLDQARAKARRKAQFSLTVLSQALGVPVRPDAIATDRLV